MIESEDLIDYCNYSKIKKLREQIEAYEAEYATRLNMFHTAFSRMVDILVGNNIKPSIIDNMTYKIVSDFQATYLLANNQFQFSIEILLKHKKTKPNLILQVKNDVTSFKVNQTFYILEDDTELHSRFMLYFRNVFASYIKLG